MRQSWWHCVGPSGSAAIGTARKRHLCEFRGVTGRPVSTGRSEEARAGGGSERRTGRDASVGRACAFSPASLNKRLPPFPGGDRRSRCVGVAGHINRFPRPALPGKAVLLEVEIELLWIGERRVARLRPQIDDGQAALAAIESRHVCGTHDSGAHQHLSERAAPMLLSLESGGEHVCGKETGFHGHFAEERAVVGPPSLREAAPRQCFLGRVQ